MSLVNSIKAWWGRRHPKTLEDIDTDDVRNEIVSPARVIGMFEDISGFEFKYKTYRDEGAEGAYFVCPDCKEELRVSHYGFDHASCVCGKEISVSKYAKAVIAEAVGHYEFAFSGI